MIRSALLTALLGLTTPAFAQDDDAPEETEEAPAGDDDSGDPISKYRTTFAGLAERTIGTASVPVAFDWRRTKVHVAGTGSFLAELNNFGSLRGGGMVRIPNGGSIVEISATYARVWNTQSSRLLALTPYRQPGRPNRLELDLGLALPLAEGVVTARSKIFPAAQLVFNAHGSVRYLIYPTGYPGMRPGEVARSIFSPSLLEVELDNLDDNRLDAMEIDPGRYGLMFGIGNDIYFEQGLFISPRMMLAVPILAPASQTRLLVWGDFSLAVGWAF